MSGLFFGGAPRQVLELWGDRVVELVVTEEVLEEYRRVGAVLAERYPGVDAGPFLDLVARTATKVAPRALRAPATSDPDDERFFEAAVGGDASIIVSGDKHVLSADGRYGVRVLKPANFLGERPWQRQE